MRADARQNPRIFILCFGNEKSQTKRERQLPFSLARGMMHTWADTYTTIRKVIVPLLCQLTITVL